MRRATTPILRRKRRYCRKRRRGVGGRRTHCGQHPSLFAIRSCALDPSPLSVCHQVIHIATDSAGRFLGMKVTGDPNVPAGELCFRTTGEFQVADPSCNCQYGCGCWQPEHDPNRGWDLVGKFLPNLMRPWRPKTPQRSTVRLPNRTTPRPLRRGVFRSRKDIRQLSSLRAGCMYTFVCTHLQVCSKSKLRRRCMDFKAPSGTLVACWFANGSRENQSTATCQRMRLNWTDSLSSFGMGFSQLGWRHCSCEHHALLPNTSAASSKSCSNLQSCLTATYDDTKNQTKLYRRIIISGVCHLLLSTHLLEPILWVAAACKLLI